MYLAPVHRMAQHTEVDAPAGVLYGLIADALRWPVFLPPTVHVEQLEFDGESERLRMWVTANDEIRSWTTRRVLDPVAHRVDFRQEVLPRPVTSMGGSWSVEPRGPERSLVTLRNDFSVDGNARADVDWVRRATTANSRAALANLRGLAERWRRLDDLVLSFEDTTRVDAPVEPVYDFLHRFGDRPDAVPGATGIDIAEQAPGVQLMTVRLNGADGTARTTESVRIGFPHAGRIVYKDVRDSEQPALLAAHAGEWSVEPEPWGTGVTVVARHHAVLDEDGVRERYGDGADAVRLAREALRARLARESAAALRLAKEHAEGALAAHGA
ncbi:MULTISPECIES: aromatase/cyclase [Streptomyces]|uniref:Cyclase n=2 Tax=Streptomyces TaxID=1883 RepID=A0A6N9UWY3_9ACTN|nr:MULTISPECIES: SRPBCC family protein [Streptomyces]EHN80232.1 cyclase [Streptomyces coelicoflavus ZG0656]KAF2774777.1 actinorhodin polyketide dimerase [Streptomyces sp. OM5714]KPC71340.1 cyclase [Streptomyces sp. NRRL WC-3753]MZE45878.1 cyclase [Streptomyces sp. SID5477]OWA00061.1 cyclase [Streptomyces sp. CS159]